MSDLEDLLAAQISATPLPQPVREYRFCDRKWRLDFAWPDRKVAVEVEGGTWVRGRHQRPGGFTKDCDKYNLAALEGWIVLRFTGEMVADGTALVTIRKALTLGLCGKE